MSNNFHPDPPRLSYEGIAFMVPITKEKMQRIVPRDISLDLMAISTSTYFRKWSKKEKSVLYDTAASLSEGEDLEKMLVNLFRIQRCCGTDLNQHLITKSIERLEEVLS